MSENTAANDYALAKILNERAIRIFTLVVDHKSTPDTKAINRSYVLLAHELQQIYARQPALKEIPLPICWRVIDNLETIHETAVDYTIETTEAWVDETTGDYVSQAADYGEEHNTKVSKLCIIANIDQPALTPDLEKLLNETDHNIDWFISELDKMHATLSFVSYDTPIITIGDTSYRLKSMRNGKTFEIVSYCLENYPDEFVGLTAIKKHLQLEELGEADITNLRDKLRGSHFEQDGPLQPFIKVSPRKIMIKKTTALTDEQIRSIDAVSRKFNSD